MIQIDQTACTGCGLCVADCFPDNIRIQAGKAVPQGACMACGHCYAICPVGAVTMTDYPTDGVVTMADAQGADADALLTRIKLRRSIRRFQEKPLARQTLEQLLEAGRFTPTGGNRQDVCYTVIQKELAPFKTQFWENFQPALDRLLQTDATRAPMVQRLRQLGARHAEVGGKDGLFFNAPVLLVIMSPSPLNGGLAAASIELMASAMGLGALYSGYIQAILGMQPDLCLRYGIDNRTIRACLLLGWPDVTYQRTAPRLPVTVTWQ